MGERGASSVVTLLTDMTPESFASSAVRSRTFDRYASPSISDPATLTMSSSGVGNRRAISRDARSWGSSREKKKSASTRGERSTQRNTTKRLMTMSPTKSH